MIYRIRDAATNRPIGEVMKLNPAQMMEGGIKGARLELS